MILYKDKLGYFFSEKDYLSEVDNIVSEYNLKASDPSNEKPFKIDHEDLVTGVPSYFSLEELDSALAEFNLVSYLTAPKDYSISRILSENWCSHFQRQILGIDLLDINGLESKTGGKVIKNVAGYDLSKIFLGSYNAFALINYAYLRVNKVFEKDLFCKLVFEKDKILTYLSGNLIHFLTELEANFFDPSFEIFLNYDSENLYLFSKSTGQKALLLSRENTIKKAFSSYFPPSALKDLALWQEESKKTYPENLPRIIFNTQAETMDKLFFSLMAICDSLNMKLQKQSQINLNLYPAKKTIELVSPLALFDSILENLDFSYDFIVNLYPISFKNKVLERKINQRLVNPYEEKLSRQIKGLYDSHGLLNPGILFDARNN